MLDSRSIQTASPRRRKKTIKKRTALNFCVWVNIGLCTLGQAKLCCMLLRLCVPKYYDITESFWMTYQASAILPGHSTTTEVMSVFCLQTIPTILSWQT